MKNVSSPQEDRVNVKPAYVKHTFKEPTALVIKVFFLSVRTRKLQYLEYVIVIYYLDDCAIHEVR